MSLEKLKTIDNRYLKKTNTGRRDYIFLDLLAYLRETSSVKGCEYKMIIISLCLLVNISRYSKI